MSDLRSYGNDNKSAVQAKFDAQKIAFGPMMFQAAISLRNLGILDYLKKHKTGSQLKQISADLGVSKYGLTVLLEAGLSMEMVYVQEDQYFLTKTGLFILSDPLTKANMDFTQDVNYLGMFNLQDSIEQGKPVGLKVFGEWDTIYEGLSSLPPKVQKSWFDFDHYYSDNAFPEVLKIVFAHNVKRLLDVGGNTGKWSIQCAKYNQEVAVNILDLPGQLEMAQKNIEVNNLQDRVSGVAANLLDHSHEFPKGYDVVWMSQFLDCFSEPDIVSLLVRAKNALSDDGCVYILETYWDQQKYQASTYSLHATSLYFTALANGNSRMYHSQDMYEMVDQAGMRVVEEFQNIGISHTLLKCAKK
ncbi:class I SAM-dependent methyltransferase [Persicobacter psychrovividus]|uniref:O-methyltransferase n=1 Tax=Persicobacter psychrovividus TaxID=387638 RepID=A0ABM7VMD4_9BACT|nr:O-methyltransferase [Persicobacter psychrovividus]